MKIKPEHYEILLRAMSEKAFLLPAVRSHIRCESRPPEDFERRVRWDLFWATGLKIGDGVGSKGDLDLYAYMDDKHLDTALRAIMRTLEERS